jgi:sulfur-oxidizing protein SoxY
MGAMTRRGVLALGAVALAGPARAAYPLAAAEVERILAGRTAKEGVVKLDMPAIAENGLVVPLNVEAESPMTPAAYVKAIHVIAEANPNPLVATFRFFPESGKAAASTRIRLAETQNIIAFAEMSDGTVFTTKTEVKVTIGGCGG